MISMKGFGIVTLAEEKEIVTLAKEKDLEDELLFRA